MSYKGNLGRRKKVLCQDLSEIDFAGAALLGSPGVLERIAGINSSALCFASVQKK